jgi:hypothetical protein
MIMGDTKHAISDRQAEIARLKAEADALQAQEDADVAKAHTATIDTVTKGMSYREMCSLRDILNARIRDQYAYESDE